MRHFLVAVVVLVIAAGATFASGVGEEESFSAWGIDSVSVKADFLDVEVSADDGLVVSMSSDLPPDSPFAARGYKVRHEAAGSRLSVWVERDSLFFTGRRGGKLSLQCPRNVKLRVETVTGRIVVKGMESRSCAVNTISGRISMRDIHGAMNASSISGSISLDAVEGRVIIKTVSGGIEGRAISLAEDSSFSSVSGNIDMRLENAPDDVRFNLSSLSGRIIVGNIRAAKGLRMGMGRTLVRGQTVSGSLIFR
jgi:hypothetical protein